MKSQKKKSPAKVGKATPAKVTPKAAAKVTKSGKAAKVTPPTKPQHGGAAVKATPAKVTPPANPFFSICVVADDLKNACLSSTNVTPELADECFMTCEQIAHKLLEMVFENVCKAQGKKPEDLFITARYEGMKKEESFGYGRIWNYKATKKPATVKKSRKG